MKKTIAVDFDGCLCEAKWPDIGAPRWDVINELRKQQADGAKLILWTCREGQQLQAAVMWCLNHGLKFDAINDNLEENKEYFGNNSRKVWASEYWDDKSALVVNAGPVTNIVYRNYYGDGGMMVKRWKGTDEALYALSPDGKTTPFILPGKTLWGRLKAWWKLWRCE